MEAPGPPVRFCRVRPLTAFRLRPASESIEPSSRQREWMPKSAKLCLPLLIANQSGWVLSNPQTFTASWDGGDSPDAIAIDHPLGRNAVVSSHFGSGILTWSLDYLFRTPPGWNLWVRGPVNLPKDGASPLEGVVETDWADATFTMNWKLTRPGHPVTFEAGEPFCMIVPQARGELESFHPDIRPVEDDPETEARLDDARRRRSELQVKKFVAQYVPSMRTERDDWEGNYYRGTPPGQEAVADHQVRLKLRKFENR
jgi:Family of unknown function (DUF6065)